MWSIGIDLGGTKIEAAKVSSEGNVIERLRTPTDVLDGPEAVEEQIEELVRQLQNHEQSKAKGLGIGIAAQIDKKTGEILSAPNLDWKNVPLKERLEKKLKLPVAITNDVRAAAWGEWLHGAGKGADDMICVFIGTGIGGGIVSGGRMLTGFSNTAGEIGHMVIRMGGRKCSCNNQGCWEAYGGGWAMAEIAQEAVRKHPEEGAFLKGLSDKPTGKELTEGFHKNDPLSLTIIESVIQAHITGFTNLVNAFNPEKLIVGGGVVEHFPELLNYIEEGVRRYALQAAVSNVVFQRAKLKNDSGVVGAASLLFLH